MSWILTNLNYIQAEIDSYFRTPAGNIFLTLSLLSQSNLTSFSLLLAEKGTALGTRTWAEDVAIFVCSFRNLIRNVGITVVDERELGCSRVFQRLFYFKLDSMSYNCTLHGFQCKIMLYEMYTVLLQLCDYFKAGLRDRGQSFLLHIGKSLTILLYENPWTRQKKRDEQTCHFPPPHCRIWRW